MTARIFFDQMFSYSFEKIILRCFIMLTARKIVRKNERIVTYVANFKKYTKMYT